MLKIQYKEYEHKILTTEMSPLLSSSDFCDILLVCKDGKLASSSLLLASLSPFMRTLLDSVQRIDAFRMIILPEEVTISQVILLHKILLDDPSFTTNSSLPKFTSDQREKIRSLSLILGCPSVVDLTQV